MQRNMIRAPDDRAACFRYNGKGPESVAEPEDRQDYNRQEVRKRVGPMVSPFVRSYGGRDATGSLDPGGGTLCPALRW